MIKPDIIVCWPRNCDYPLWRQFIREQRQRFNEIIVVFTDTFEQNDYSEFVRKSMFRDHVIFCDNRPLSGSEDWRDVAIHQALMHSYNSEWIWFTEQDFFCKKGFWEFVYTQAEIGNADVICTYDETRMHPCNIIIKRKTLMEKTRQNFAIVPDISDHFSRIQKELEGNAEIVKMPQELYYHMNGLSSNFSQIERNGKPNWNPEIFNAYIERCLLANIEMSSQFTEVCEAYKVREYQNFVKNDSVFS